MWNNVSLPISHVVGWNRHFNSAYILIFTLQYSNIKVELWRLSGIVAHQFPTSAWDSSSQTSLHIEINMRIDELKPNRYVGPKIRSMLLRVASESVVGSLRIFDFRFSICRVVVSGVRKMAKRQLWSMKDFPLGSYLSSGMRFYFCRI